MTEDTATPMSRAVAESSPGSSRCSWRGHPPVSTAAAWAAGLDPHSCC